jgi:type VI secretion system protein ImpG
VRDELFDYYERELAYLRDMGKEFAQRYPRVASRLQLEPNKCEDPHVERLLEGFALLAARVHLKIDDDFPEITEALLGVLYPHYVRPIPSMSIAELQVDPERKLTAGYTVPRGTLLYTRAAGGVQCRFRSCYDTTLWPFGVAAAQWLTPDRLRPEVRAPEAVAALRVELRCPPDVPLDALGLSALRLHLDGESALVATLYELLCNSCTAILVRGHDAAGVPTTVTLPPEALRPVGFADEEAVLPSERRSLAAYRLLQEYFAFPAKFLFLDLTGLEALADAGLTRGMEVVFLVAPFERPDRRHLLETGVTARTVRLGCTPVINLFSQTSEPIELTHTKYEYPLVADARRRLTTEVYAVDEVVGAAHGSRESVRFEPFYSYRHDSRRGGHGVFWSATRRRSGWRTDGATEVHLSFVDLAGEAVAPDVDAVTARLTCYNGDLPSRLPVGDPAGDFELQGGGPVRRVAALVKPTPVVQPPLGKSQLWRLVSQLSLNHLSLVDGGAESLREILRLHAFGDGRLAEEQIRGIVDVRSGPAYARVAAEHGLTFARGRRVEVEFDEDQFAGGGVYLFAAVLERFLGLYASLNSFSALVARTRQRKAVVAEWPARAGSKCLL